MGLPCRSRIFFLGTRWEPPRAGMTARHESLLLVDIANDISESSWSSPRRPGGDVVLCSASFIWQIFGLMLINSWNAHDQSHLHRNQLGPSVGRTVPFPRMGTIPERKPYPVLGAKFLLRSRSQSGSHP